MLVVDQYEPKEASPEQYLRHQNLAEQIGAQAVLVFEETIDIPANDIPVDPDGNPLFLKMHVEGDFEQFREQVQDEIRKAQDDLTRAIQDAKLRATSDNGWTGRPKRPDGTPYGYSEIAAGGWEACEGCRTWGQWTIENPHHCPGTYIQGPITKPAADA
ncbi:hypothetical protein [Streptomyces sp. NPDC003832]